MAKKEFFVLSALATRISMDMEADRFAFNAPQASVVLFPFPGDLATQLSGFTEGWLVEVKVEAPDLDAAIQGANNYIELFLSTMTFQAGIGIEKARVILAYEITKNVPKRPFRQYFYDSGYKDSPQVRLDSLSDYVRKLSNMKETHKARTLRGLRWLRKGLLADDPLDQFMFLWQGLESLNSPLASVLGVPKAGKVEISRKCPECGAKYKETVEGKGGILRLLDELDADSTTKKEINLIRNAVSHGFHNLSPLYDRAIELLPTIAEALYLGISKIIGITPRSDAIASLQRISPIKLGEFLYLEANLLQADETKLASQGPYPFFTLSYKGGAPRTPTQIAGQSHFTPNLSCSWECVALGISGRNIDVKADIKRPTCS